MVNRQCSPPINSHRKIDGWHQLLLLLPGVAPAAPAADVAKAAPAADVAKAAPPAPRGALVVQAQCIPM